MIALTVSTILVTFAVGSDAFAYRPVTPSSPAHSLRAGPYSRLTRLQENVGVQDVEVSVEATKSKKYVVVGGGWAGWGAAKALCERWAILA